MSTPRVVLVVGMHRSGTSAVALALAAAGLDLGDRSGLVPPHRDNPAGYFERTAVVAFNDRLLAALGWAWDTPDAAPLAQPPALTEMVSEGRGLIAATFAGGRPCVVKDPRLSLVLPWWRQILGDRFVAVVPLRDPVAVAASLAVRDRFPAPLGLVLWTAYQRHLAYGLAGLPVLTVDYASLAAEPDKVTADLIAGLKALGVATDMNAGRAATAVRPDLHRQVPPVSASAAASEAEWLAAMRTAWRAAAAVTAHRSFALEVPPPTAFELAVLATHRRGRDENLLLREELDRLAADRDRLMQTIAASPSAGGRGAGRAASSSSARAGVAGLAGRIGRRLPKPFRRVVHATATRASKRMARANPLLDAAWYSEEYADVLASGIDPHQHYRRFGWREGRNPNPYFATRWYLERNSDVRDQGIDPLDHYLERGAREGRDPGPRFSTRRYLEEHPEVERAGINPLLHFLGSAKGERRHR